MGQVVQGRESIMATYTVVVTQDGSTFTVAYRAKSAENAMKRAKKENRWFSSLFVMEGRLKLAAYSVWRGM